METLLYGACLWGGAQYYLISKIQKLQLEACRIAIGYKSQRWSTKTLLHNMNWLSVKQILERENVIMTHKIMNKS